MIKLLFIALHLSNLTNTDTCINKLTDRLFANDFYANYWLCIPVTTSDGKARIVLEKEHFKKYMAAIYQIDEKQDSIKVYLTQVLTRKKNLHFYLSAYENILHLSGCKILKGENKYLTLAKKNKAAFLKKYLGTSNEKDTYFNLNYENITTENYHSIIEALFNLKFIVAEGHGFTAVYKIDCSGNKQN